MKIFNVMFSKVNGGLEQVFLNYTDALASFGHEVFPIIHPKAQIKAFCKSENLIQIHNFNQHDYLAVWKLKRFIKKHQPDCIITHSHRAAYLIKKTKTKVPTIAVCHVKGNYQFGTNAIIALTESMRKDIIQAGVADECVFTVPNMINTLPSIERSSSKCNYPMVIGTCVRFTEQKGCDVFIRACAELKKRKVPFKALVAGDGPEKRTYETLIESLDLREEISLLGWVDDKDAFYEKLDMFVLPSREEAFGLVLVESMMHGLPLVVTDLPGPREVIGDSGAAAFVPGEDFVGMAEEIEKLIQDEIYRQHLSQLSLKRAIFYSHQNVVPLLEQALLTISSPKSHI